MSYEDRDTNRSGSLLVFERRKRLRKCNVDVMGPIGIAGSPLRILCDVFIMSATRRNVHSISKQDPGN